MCSVGLPVNGGMDGIGASEATARVGATAVGGATVVAGMVKAGSGSAVGACDDAPARLQPVAAIEISRIAMERLTLRPFRHAQGRLGGDRDAQGAEL